MVNYTTSSNGPAVNTILFTECACLQVARHSGKPTHTHTSQWQSGRSSLLRLGTFLAAFNLHGSLPATSNSDHGGQVPTTEGEGGDNLSVEYSRRSFEYRGEYLECHTSQDSFWFRQCPSCNDKGTLPALLQRSAPFLHLTRTQ